jgi:mannitol-1-phosphate 5-dehydrogenase
VKRKAVQFGAGNIGRGFIAQLFFESGYEIVFVDVRRDLVEEINRRGSYKIRVVDGWEVEVSGIRAVDGKEEEAVAREVASSDIVATAVGVSNLKEVARPIALGISIRFSNPGASPLNVLVCENSLDAAKDLKGFVAALVPSEDILNHVGFIPTVISRMVPSLPDEERGGDILLVAVEAYKKLPVERGSFVGPIPDIEGLVFYDDLKPYVERKLYIHNGGHAILAYLGYLKGYRYIHEAMGDPWIRGILMRAWGEMERGLFFRHRFDPGEHSEYMEDLTRRLENPFLRDTIARVAREPLRKLRKEDRLVGAALCAMEAGVRPVNISCGIAAAMLYEDKSDPQAIELSAMMMDKGARSVLRDVCGLDPEGEIGRLVLDWLFKLKGREVRI